MERLTKSAIKSRSRYKKLEENRLKVNQNLKLKFDKEKEKESDSGKEKEKKSFDKNKKNKKAKNDEKSEKKEKEKNDEQSTVKKEKKELEIKNLKLNKSINYILSDNETTRGDTFIDTTKKKYIYKKVFNKKNFALSINNYIKNKVPNTYEKRHRLNNSLSLSKFCRNKENDRNTKFNIFKKQSSILANYHTTYNLDDSIKILSKNKKEFNNTFFAEKNEQIINVEDLLILEEKFNDVLMSIKSKHNIPNECFELLNSYQQSSLFNNFENYFKDKSSKSIIHTSIMYFIYNTIICYHFSLDYSFFNTCCQYLESVLEINYKSYLLLCELISLKVHSNSKDNIWVDKLRKLIKDNLKHVELNNKDYINFLMKQDYNYKNKNLNILLEIKFYSNQINKYIQLFLNIIDIENSLKKDFENLFDNINNISEDKLLHFFKSKIIRVINQNASVAGIESSSSKILLNENNIKPPYLKLPSPKKFSLVLDLDETLISFKLNPDEENKGTIRFRPYLDSFLQRVKQKYEIIVFTSGTKDYADPLEDAIEQERKYFDARLYRQHTIAYGKDIIKDISRIGRPLDKIIIVENMQQNYRLQKENGILIKSFYGEDKYDTALASLGDILIKIADEFTDVRKGILKYKNEILNKVSSNLSKKDGNKK